MRDDAPAVSGEELEQRELPRSQLEHFACDRRSMSTRIDGQRADRQGCRWIGRDGAELGTDPSAKHGERERLRDVVVGASVEPDDDVDVVVLGRHDDDAQLWRPVP